MGEGSSGDIGQVMFGIYCSDASHFKANFKEIKVSLVPY